MKDALLTELPHCSISLGSVREAILNLKSQIKAEILFKWKDKMMVRGKMEENMFLMLRLHLMNVFVPVGLG